MKRIRILGLCLVAVFAVSVAASSASAAPVFYTKTEVQPGAKIKFTATIGAAFLEGEKTKAKISCTDVAGGGSGAVGEVTGPVTNENNITTFTGCKSGELPCASTGAPAETIVTKALKGHLGDVVTGKTPGVRLYSQSEGRGGKLAEFECGGGIAKVVVTGSVIGQLAGASGKTVSEGKFATTQKLTFAETGGKQKYTIFTSGGEVGEKAEQLTSTINGSSENGGQSVIATIKAEGVSNLGNTL